MRRTAMVRWIEAAEAKRFRQMALQMPAPSVEQGRLPLAVLMAKLQSMVRLEIVYWRLVRRATRSPA